MQRGYYQLMFPGWKSRLKKQGVLNWIRIGQTRPTPKPVGFRVPAGPFPLPPPAAHCLLLATQVESPREDFHAGSWRKVPPGRSLCRGRLELYLPPVALPGSWSWQESNTHWPLKKSCSVGRMSTLCNLLAKGDLQLCWYRYPIYFLLPHKKQDSFA